MSTAVSENIVKVERYIGGMDVIVWRNKKNTKSDTFPPVIMIHGMFGGGWYFKDWARFLCEKGFPVYVIKDLHKGEDLNKVDFYTYAEKSTRVAEAIYNTTGKKAIILGHSMGGLIAQEIAKTKSELVEGIVLVTSAPPKGISSMSWSVAKAMVKHLPSLVFNSPLEIDKKSAFELILNHFGSDEKQEKVFKKFVPESSRVAKQLAFSQIPIDEKKISCKSLVVSGRYDRLLPLKIQNRIAQKYDSDYISILAGHMPMLESGQEEVIKRIWYWIE